VEEEVLSLLEQGDHLLGGFGHVVGSLDDALRYRLLVHLHPSTLINASMGLPCHFFFFLFFPSQKSWQ